LPANTDASLAGGVKLVDDGMPLAIVPILRSAVEWELSADRFVCAA